MKYMIAGRLIWKSELQQVKPKPNSKTYSKCTAYMTVLKTDCADFAYEDKTIMVVAWKDKAEELAILRSGKKRGQIVEIFFTERDYRRGLNSKKEPIMVVKPNVLIGGDERDLEKYCFNEHGQRDYHTRLITKTG